MAASSTGGGGVGKVRSRRESESLFSSESTYNSLKVVMSSLKDGGSHLDVKEPAVKYRMSTNPFLTSGKETDIFTKQKSTINNKPTTQKYKILKHYRLAKSLYKSPL